MKHSNSRCVGAICRADTIPGWEKNVAWYPGEPICSMRPFDQMQRIQGRINILFGKNKLKYPDTCYTSNMLMNKKSVYPGIKGRGPNKTC